MADKTNVTKLLDNEFVMEEMLSVTVAQVAEAGSRVLYIKRLANTSTQSLAVTFIAFDISLWMLYR